MVSRCSFMTLISHTQKYFFNTYVNYETTNVGQLALSIAFWHTFFTSALSVVPVVVQKMNNY